MSEISIRHAKPTDFPVIVALNASEVQHTSVMDQEQLTHLDSIAAYHKVVVVNERVGAFLLALRENTNYQSENYLWFSSHYTSFLYVDRIVVSAEFAGKKLGSSLYQDLIEFAGSSGVGVLTCEYNVVPPNEPSQRFHSRFGFKEVGSQWLANDTKKVSLQARRIQ
ncbi:MAG: GNAT family N-acetyltransferase [Gammaproteobacteria bacterium]|nr:GNAT family N-acetyltransferase [Gammaproteobacteria bacterium]